MADIQPFHVMALLSRARELEAGGRRVVHMEVGEPDFSTPAPIVEAGMRAMREGRTHYTAATGLPALREAIASYYASHYALSVDPARVLITPGASGALHLLMETLVDPGDEVLLADPGYPCNRHLARLAEAKVIPVSVSSATGYHLTPDLVAAHGTTRTRVVMVASPSNPTGTLLAPESLRAVHRAAASLDAHLVSDEIYHGLVYGEQAASALSLGEDVFVVNSFSKYWGMTGWRLGWLVAPEGFVGDLDKLAQNVFLAAPTPAQHAALVAFEPDTIAILEERRREFQVRRDYLLPALEGLGFRIPVKPTGAFYIYADCSAFTDDSYELSERLLEEAGVAITPGIDFGLNEAERYLRFAYTTSMEDLVEGVERMQRFLTAA